jgi:hypothetical protein
MIGKHQCRKAVPSGTAFFASLIGGRADIIPEDGASTFVQSSFSDGVMYRAAGKMRGFFASLRMTILIPL